MQVTRSLVALAVFMVLALALPAFAQESPGSPGSGSTYTSAWIDQTTRLSDEAVAEVVDGLARQDPNPEHVVVFVHGFATPRSRSTAQYDVLAPRVRSAFEKLGKRVSILGIQWDSEAMGGLLDLPGEYSAKVLRARSVGRFGVRQVLVRLQERFPRAHVSILAHSMGCEVSVAAGSPELKFGDVTDSLGAFESDKEIQVNTLVLAGSDLDYDAGYKGRYNADFHRVGLLWMTMSRLYRRDRDKVLDLRALIRGKAQGSTFPRMTSAQYEALFAGRKAIFDNEGIPPTHDLLKYYDEARLARLVASMVYRVDPTAVPKPVDLNAIDEVMDAPPQVEALVPFLDSRQFSGIIYSLWRLEGLLGDGSRHFEDEYLSHIGNVAYDCPRALRHRPYDSPCETVRRGYWPTPTALARAGAPQWADPLGSVWEKDFRGEVVALEQNLVRVLTDFGDLQTFYLVPGHTSVTPSLDGLRVGSKVRVRSDFDHSLLMLTVIPLHAWMAEHPEE